MGIFNFSNVFPRHDCFRMFSQWFKEDKWTLSALKFVLDFRSNNFRRDLNNVWISAQNCNNKNQKSNLKSKSDMSSLTQTFLPHIKFLNFVLVSTLSQMLVIKKLNICWHTEGYKTINWIYMQCQQKSALSTLLSIYEKQDIREI